MSKRTAFNISVLALPAAFLIAVIIIANFTFSLVDPPLSLYGINNIDSGWVQSLHNGQRKTLNLPADVKTEENSVFIENTLPTEIGRNSILGIKVHYERLKVSVNGQLIYEIGYKDKAPFGSVFGYLWNFIPIKEEYAGKTISLEFYSPIETDKLSIDSILYGNEGAAFFKIICDNQFVILICELLLLTSIFFFLFSLILHKKYPQVKMPSNMYLGLFFLLTALWLFSDSDVTQFISGGRTIFYLMSFFSFMLIPVPFLLFINELSLKKRTSIYVLCGLFAVNIFICTVLYITNTLDLIQTILTTHALICISIITTAFILFKEFKQNNKEIREIAIGIALLLICSSVSLIQYNKAISDYSRFFRYGILLFGAFISISAIKKVLSLINDSIKVSTYKILAYTDSLTGLSNRAAFSEAVGLVDVKKNSLDSVAMIVLDLDNLKPINDSLGHITGDELIKGVSECLRSAFSAIGQCFRIGGDEFSVLLININKDEVDKRLKKLGSCIEDYNKSHKGKIALSTGLEYCSGRELEGLSISDIFNRADEKMYENKKSKGQIPLIS